MQGPGWEALSESPRDLAAAHPRQKVTSLFPSTWDRPLSCCD